MTSREYLDRVRSFDHVLVPNLKRRRGLGGRSPPTGEARSRAAKDAVMTWVIGIAGVLLP